MQREISAGKAGTSGLISTRPFRLCEQEEMLYNKATTRTESSSSQCRSNFHLRSILKNMEEALMEVFKATNLPSPPPLARKHVKLC